jgi:hypothetical protein
MKDLLQKSCLIFSLLFLVSCAAAEIEGEDKPAATTHSKAITEYTAAERSTLLKKGCELHVYIKGIQAEGTFIIRIKEDFSPKTRKAKKAIVVKALEPCCSRFEIMQAESSGGAQKRIVTNDESEAASYKKGGAEVNQIYGDSMRYVQFPDNQEEILLFFLPTRRMEKLPLTMATKRMFMDVFHFSYGDILHAIEQLVTVDELQFGREIISVKERHFKDLSPGIFFWMTSD